MNCPLLRFYAPSAHNSIAGMSPPNERPEIMSAKNESEIVAEIAPSATAMTPKQLATELGIMRSMAQAQPGSGARWEIDTEFADALRQRVSRSHNRKVVKFVPKG
jgi:hypothetical protein